MKVDFKVHEIEGYIESIYLVEENNHLMLLDGCCKPDVPLVLNFIQVNKKRKFRNILFPRNIK